ncbi:phosphoethanolamine [Neohortaea acidophila]|uniref:ethanolamine-phosphate cytidylyltransferase n=1 Tax=Neohortaea acidophila TaxID=245834 RepID=A0A6A6PM91_9PEZI|nr:phosphoethanolamine [Neohortaea acidophila]KAF2480811.1 phosphoethanolamine [Neohortaea acidophila]
MPPTLDPHTHAIVPHPGEWPVDPQEDQPIRHDRLWIDGCFDFFHHGHTGVMLQSRRLGASLLVGLHTDEEIAANKGPTVMSLAERVAAVDACRFATQCIPRAPYVTSLAWISHYGCWFVTHGDDITSDANGEDCYRFVKEAGRMKIVRRTEGISTTDLVGRMLGASKEHFIKSLPAVLEGQEGRERMKETPTEMKRRIEEYAAAEDGLDSWVQVYSFEDSAQQQNGHAGSTTPLVSLVSGQPPRPGQRIVYVDGSFDLFSSGHIAFLETTTALEHAHAEARNWYDASAAASRIAQTGSDYGPAYIIAGLHSDAVVNAHRGVNYPIMNIYERGLCAIQCRYVHSVILSAPIIPTKEYLSSLPTGLPDVVYHGPTSFLPTPTDPYADAKSLGIFQQVGPHRFQDVDSAQIVQRILDKREEYEARQRKKGIKAVGEEAARREEMEREAEAKAKLSNGKAAS